MAGTLPTPNDCCSLCDGLTVTIITDGGGGSGGAANLIVAETLAALRSQASSSNNRLAILLGEDVKYDFGPAKSYYWDAESTEADNPLAVVVPDDDSGSGRWVQVS